RELARVISPDAADAITNAMVGAVESDVGRQFTTGAKVPGVLTAGKSGTAELGGTGAPHSWFIGFAPADHPQVAIAVIVERGGRGGAPGGPRAGGLRSMCFQLVLCATRDHAERPRFPAGRPPRGRAARPRAPLPPRRGRP